MVFFIINGFLEVGADPLSLSSFDSDPESRHPFNVVMWG